MPGVLKTDCRVKPEVKSFTRLGPSSRDLLECVLNPLFKRSSCTGGGNVTTEEGS
jgi:hypothetical protein